MTKLSCALCVELCQARGHIVDALARLNGAVHVLNLRVGSPPRTAVQFIGRMSQHFPVCLAEFFAIKSIGRAFKKSVPSAVIASGSRTSAAS
jgi:hypothetical protein